MSGAWAPSFMRAEIEEIPAAARRFLDGARDEIARVAAALSERDPDLLVTIARGSSDHAATYLKYVAELVAGVPVASVGPSVASIYHARLRLGRAAAIGISQSGQSADIVEMMRAAGGGGALTLAITNFADSPMGRSVDHTLALRVGAERSVAATKTFVVSVLAGLALVAEWRGDAALAAAVEAAPDAFARALACDWTPLADRLAEAEQIFVIGRGPGFAVAGEMALKFKETCGVHAASYSAAEVMHGPAALIGARFPVLALGIEDEALPQLVATAERLVGQGADVFLTAGQVEGAVILPHVEGLHPRLAPLALIIAFYGCVEALARRKGFNPDEPPNLRKVTSTL